jgi:hypothetical protein
MPSQMYDAHLPSSQALTVNDSDMAEYLADPNFPEKVMEANRAGKISSFQALYRQYSRLDFSHDEDRPFAIAGLEARLQRALNTMGDYGIFDDGNTADGGLFHRSLLWQRGEEAGDPEFMSPIPFPKNRNIQLPSWSWMGYKGGIDYTDPPWDSAEWETKELIAPWTKGNATLATLATPVPRTSPVAFSARVRDFDVRGRRYDEVKLEYDTGKTSLFENQQPQCVVVAKSKDTKVPNEKRFYVLLVASTREVDAEDELIYKRVGAGYMLGKFISLDGKGTAAKII